MPHAYSKSMLPTFSIPEACGLGQHSVLLFFAAVGMSQEHEDGSGVRHVLDTKAAVANRVEIVDLIMLKRDVKGAVEEYRACQCGYLR